MSEHTAESKTGSWSSPESHLTIDYPLELLDEIRLAVSASFHANPRRGVEIAGAFFGARTETGVRIAAWRPISREHSYEASFVLSEKDLVDLDRLLDSAATDSLLNGLEPVGWFVPHARGSLEPNESELHVFDRFFPREWQFTMVLKPGLAGPTKAAFFVRNDGKLCGHTPDREFTIEPLRAARVHGHGRRNPPPGEPVPPAGMAAQRRGSLARAQRSAIDANGAPPDPNLVRIRPGRPLDARRELAPPPPLPFDEQPAWRAGKKWLRWLWGIPVAGLLIYAAWVARERFLTEPRPATLSLRLQDWPGAQLHVDWEGQAQPIQVARRGEIVFEDAARLRIVDLDAAQLRLGSFAYARRSGNVKVKLSVYGENSVSPAIEEVAEFNGLPPDDAALTPARAATADRLVPAKEKADLEAEIKRLRGQLATETAKRQELQNLVRVLENRLGLTPGK